MKSALKKTIPHVVAITLFLLATVIYFSPMILDGKQVRQYDILQYFGSAQEIIDYRERTGEEALWTNSMFGGMPAYQISVIYSNNWLRQLYRFLTLGLPSPAYMIFLSMLGFYIMLLCFKVDPWLAIAGAFAYGLSTYLLIIAGAGHNSKMRAMALMPMIIGGMYLAYARGKILTGALIVCLALGMQIRVNHLQITYYTAIVAMIFMVLEIVRISKEKQYLIVFLKTSAAMVIAVTLAVSVNTTKILLTLEYTPYSTRGQSELTDETGNQTRGLDKSYILDDYSYGIVETMNLFIPNFMGGSSGSKVGTSSPFYKALIENGINRRDAVEISRSVPTYWGGQRLTSGPVYIGAAVVFLFVLGLFVVKGRIKWWLVTSLALCIALAWGNNFRLLSDLFIDFFPGYNKFRTVSMILVIAQLVIPLLGILAIKEILCNELSINEKQKAIKNSFFIVGGSALFFALFSGTLLSFSSPNDAMLSQYGFPDWLIATLPDTRHQLLRNDAYRSLFFVTGAAAVVWFMVSGKLKYAPAIILISGLIVADLWTVDKRYLNNSHFAARGVNNAPRPSSADLEILQDESLSYRVMNTTVSVFNDATTSFFHKSVGGYHGAKMQRYQDIIERHIGRFDMQTLNMLNTKYFIVGDRSQPAVRENPDALGNAWAVDRIIWVNNADEEIEALNDFEPANEAIVDIRFRSVLEGFTAQHDSTATVELISYEPNNLVYRYESQLPQLIVFSEIFYSMGWNAYINGELSPHIRANYVLRAMPVSAGKHEIVFKFEPENFKRGERIALISSILIALFAVCVVIRNFQLHKA